MPSSNRISLTSIGSSVDRYRFDVTQFTNLHITMPRDENSRRRSRLPVIFLAEFIRGPPLFQTVVTFPNAGARKGVRPAPTQSLCQNFVATLGSTCDPKTRSSHARIAPP